MSIASDKLSGKAKQALGKVTDDRELELKGKAQEAKGSIKQTVQKIAN